MRPVMAMVSLQRAGAEVEVRPRCRVSLEVGAEEAEEAAEAVGLLHHLLLCWERVAHEEEVGPPESESDWRAVVEEVMCCVWVYWRARSAREGEEGADHHGSGSEMVVVVVAWPRGKEEAEEEEGPGRLWTVLG